MRDIHMEKPMDVFIGTKLRAKKDMYCRDVTETKNVIIKKGQEIEITGLTTDYGPIAYEFYNGENYMFMHFVPATLWEVVK